LVGMVVRENARPQSLHLSRLYGTKKPNNKSQVDRYGKKAPPGSSTF